MFVIACPTYTIVLHSGTILHRVKDYCTVVFSTHLLACSTMEYRLVLCPHRWKTHSYDSTVSFCGLGVSIGVHYIAFLVTPDRFRHFPSCNYYIYDVLRLREALSFSRNLFLSIFRTSLSQLEGFASSSSLPPNKASPRNLSNINLLSLYQTVARSIEAYLSKLRTTRSKTRPPRRQ
jgi:hypothetical protein